MDDSVKLEDYEQWKKENTNQFSIVDYIHAVVKTNELSYDLYFAFGELFWPQFEFVDGMVLNRNFLEKKKRYIQEGKPKEEVEYWTNILSLDGLFDHDIGEAKYTRLVQKIASAWEAKLSKDFPDRNFIVQIIDDEDDVAVTFSQATE